MPASPKEGRTSDMRYVARTSGEEHALDPLLTSEVRAFRQQRLERIGQPWHEAWAGEYSSSDPLPGSLCHRCADDAESIIAGVPHSVVPIEQDSHL
jgi:hypothetical protein